MGKFFCGDMCSVLLGYVYFFLWQFSLMRFSKMDLSKENLKFFVSNKDLENIDFNKELILV